jgi:hypothetical protein
VAHRKFLYDESIKGKTRIIIGEFAYKHANIDQTFTQLKDVNRYDILTRYFFHEFKAKNITYCKDAIVIEHEIPILPVHRSVIRRRVIEEIFPAEQTLFDISIPPRLTLADSTGKYTRS